MTIANSVGKCADMVKQYLYRVDQYNYGQLCCVDGSEDVNPKYQLSFYDSKIYVTWEDAMAHIRQSVDEDVEIPDIHHFIVKKVEIGGSPNWGVEQWVFDNHGTMLNPIYQPGDIVEIITNNLKEKCAALGIVVKEPVDYEVYYLVATAPGVKPEKLETFSLMPPQFPISDSLRKYFRQCFDTVNEDYEPTETSPVEYGFGLAGFGELAVCIDVDRANKEPHLHIVDKHCRFVVNLRLDRPEYFSDNAPSAKLQPYQILELMEHLTENINGKTRWWYMLRRFEEWYDDYNINLSLDSPLPDYTQLIHI